MDQALVLISVNTRYAALRKLFCCICVYSFNSVMQEIKKKKRKVRREEDEGCSDSREKPGVSTLNSNLHPLPGIPILVWFELKLALQYRVQKNSMHSVNLLKWNETQVFPHLAGNILLMFHVRVSLSILYLCPHGQRQPPHVLMFISAQVSHL